MGRSERLGVRYYLRSLIIGVLDDKDVGRIETVGRTCGRGPPLKGVEGDVPGP